MEEAEGPGGTGEEIRQSFRNCCLGRHVCSFNIGTGTDQPEKLVPVCSLCEESGVLGAELSALGLLRHPTDHLALTGEAH